MMTQWPRLLVPFFSGGEPVGEQAPDVFSEPAHQVLTVDALGARQQFSRQAQTGKLELKTDQDAVDEREVRDNHARKRSVVLKDEGWTDDVVWSGGAKLEIGDVGLAVVGEMNRHGGAPVEPRTSG